jgi:integrase
MLTGALTEQLAMATFTKRQGKWRVQIRRDGYPSVSKTFIAKQDAERWAREHERAIDRGELPRQSKELRTTTVGDLLIRYRDTITPTKRAKETEGFMIKTMLAHPLSQCHLRRLAPSDIAQYRDARLEKVTASTVLRELVLLTHMFNVAIKDWSLPLTSNPVALISKPRANKARDRRLEAGELEKLTEGLQQCKNPLVLSVFKFALATGMRRGEVLSLRWENVDLAGRTAHLPITKNGDSRTVPLSPAAIAVLEQLPAACSGQVFHISANAVRLAWTRMKARVGIENLRLHDLRHEAVSRFFEFGLSVPEVAAISGHKDSRMLARYTHLRATDIAAKLANQSQ